MRGQERQRTRAFSELQSHYLFGDKFGRPAKGNDEGRVEGLVGYARRSCEKVAAWVSSLALVGYRGNDYSVPTRHGHLQVLVRGYVHEVAAMNAKL